MSSGSFGGNHSSNNIAAMDRHEAEPPRLDRQKSDSSIRSLSTAAATLPPGATVVQPSVRGSKQRADSITSVSSVNGEGANGGSSGKGDGGTSGGKSQSSSPSRLYPGNRAPHSPEKRTTSDIVLDVLDQRPMR